MKYAIGAVAGLLWGALAAFINSRITKSALAKGTQNAVMSMNVAHMAVDIVALAVVFLLRSLLPFSFEAALIATAAGLSLVNIVFTYKISYEEKKED